MHWWRNFSDEDAAAVKSIEKSTNHDVKAVEYWLKQQMASRPELARSQEFVHFALTLRGQSTTCPGALIVKAAIETELDPLLARLDRQLEELAVKTADWRWACANPWPDRIRRPPWARNWPMWCFACAARRGLNQVELSARSTVRSATSMPTCRLPDIDWPNCHALWSKTSAWCSIPIPTQIEPHDMAGPNSVMRWSGSIP